MIQQRFSAAILVLLVCSGSVAAEPLEYTGVVTIDTVTASPGDQFSVPVRVRGNNAPLSAMFFPLKFMRPGLVYDSVSLVGSDLPAGYGADYNFNAVRGRLRVILTASLHNPEPFLTAANAVLFRIHFHLTPDASDGIAVIDSVHEDTVVSGFHVATRIDFAYTEGSNSYAANPGFVPGEVVIVTPSGVDDGSRSTGMSEEFSIDQNYPNPFNPSTSIRFGLPHASHVTLEVFNITGQKVATIASRRMSSGYHVLTWEGTNSSGAPLPSGVYLYWLQAGEFVAMQKMMLVKWRVVETLQGFDLQGCQIATSRQGRDSQ